MTRKAPSRSTRRSRRRGRCRPTAGCSGSPKARRSARSRPCSREVRGTVYARAKAQDAGYGLETELAEPDGALVSRRRRGARGARSAAEAARRAGPPARSGARGCARLARLRRPARGSRARSAASPGGARRWPPGSRLLARIGGAADPDFVDWLAIERVEGREFDVAIHRHWLDPTRPLAEAVLEPARRRARHLGDACAAATDWARGRGAHRRAASRRGRPRISRRRARSIMPPAPKCWSSPTSSRATSPRWPAPMRG